MDLAEFRQRMDATIDAIKSSKRRSGVEEILIPGERSSRQAAVSRRLGIALAPETVREISDWCHRLNVPFLLSEVTI
jgi:LDH2 family malate/lactate/ureidoglycolate dehydrogenase